MRPDTSSGQTDAVVNRINMAIDHWSESNLPAIKAAITSVHREGNRRPEISGINKFSCILALLFNLHRGRQVKIFHKLDLICNTPNFLKIFLEMLYEIYHNVLDDTGNMPQIVGYRSPPITRDFIYILSVLEDSTGYSVKEYKFAGAIYLHWAVLNGLTGGERRENSLLSRFFTELEERITQNAIPVSARRGTIRIQQRTPVSRPSVQQRYISSPPSRDHLKEQFIEQYTDLITNNVRKPQDCVICLESMTTKDIKVTDCGHMFHESCFNRWRKAECPTCRASTHNGRVTAVRENLIRNAANTTRNRGPVRTNPVRTNPVGTIPVGTIPVGTHPARLEFT
tara:strand:+ start:1146 stop:2165 length:1020 start_codon:yes stop_codon:yes gene_type:complete